MNNDILASDTGDLIAPSIHALAIGLTGNLRADVAAFLTSYGHAETAGHCARVAAESKRLAAQVGVAESAAVAGGLLHDVSVIIPNVERLAAARAWGVDVLPAEETFPMIIHQKLSVVIARDIFYIQDEAVLRAIGCHTTLQQGASLLDKIVFIADKIKWDQAGDPPYINALLTALAQSLDAACYCYLDYLWQTRATLKVIHPWAVAAHGELAGILGKPVKTWTT